MEGDSILVELTVRRRYRLMSPALQKAYLLVREVARIGVAAAVSWALFSHLAPGLALMGTVGVLWLLVEPWIARETPGFGRVLLTENGIHIVEDGIFCPWDDVGFHTVHGQVLVFEPGEDSVPKRLFRSRRQRIPLGPETRETIKTLFRERAGAHFK